MPEAARLVGRNFLFSLAINYKRLYCRRLDIKRTFFGLEDSSRLRLEAIYK